MRSRIVTTITTDIDLETLTPDHKVEIDAEDADGLPNEVIYAAVAGACKATLNSLPKRTRELADTPAGGESDES